MRTEFWYLRRPEMIRPGMTAEDAEHILDASFVQNAADQFADLFGLSEHSFDHHDVILLVLGPLPGSGAPEASSG
jgi:hypothetical protein